MAAAEVVKCVKPTLAASFPKAMLLQGEGVGVPAISRIQEKAERQVLFELDGTPAAAR